MNRSLAHASRRRAAATSPGRSARRKDATRRRLLEAAFRLMAEHGVDAVAINEITEGADVGIGSFYNHFQSKDALYAAVMDELFEQFGEALDRLVAGIEDAAEVISICVRHTILRARREPAWGRFLLREGFSARVLTHGLGVRLMRDMQRGAAAGRFRMTDPLMTFFTLGGAVLGAIALEINDGGAGVSAIEHLGLSRKDIPERAAAMMLRTLGVGAEQARRLSRKPLPVVEETAARAAS